MHNNSVFGINRKSCHMAHKMSRQLTCKLATVCVSPKKFGSCTVLRNANNTEIVFRIILYILKIFSCACYNKNLADKICCIKACWYCTDNIVKVEILCNLIFIKHIANVSAVSLVPTQAVHIGCCIAHFLYKRCI